MDFRNVAGLTIPAGSVNKISIGGVVVWSKKNDGRYKILKDGVQVDRITIADLVSKVQDGSAQTDYGIGAQIVIPYHDEWDNNKYQLPFNFASFNQYQNKLVLQTHYAVPSTPIPFGNNLYCIYDNSYMKKWLHAYNTEHELTITEYADRKGFLGCLPQDFVEALQDVTFCNSVVKVFIPSRVQLNVAETLTKTATSGSYTIRDYSYTISYNHVVWEYWKTLIGSTAQKLEEYEEKRKVFGLDGVTRAATATSSYFNIPSYTQSGVKYSSSTQQCIFQKNGQCILSYASDSYQYLPACVIG